MVQYRIVKNVGTIFPHRAGVGNSGDDILRRHRPVWVSIRIIASFIGVAISMFCRNLKSCGIGRVSHQTIGT